MKIKKILIVDDDVDYMNELGEFLLIEDFTVTKKNNTHKILLFIQKIKPDLIILDLKINGMTGIDVTRILKGCNATKGIPIILVSNFHNADSNNRTVIESGVQIYLKKPLNPELLINEIRKIETG